MESGSVRPGRANWIWLATGGLTVAVAGLTAFRLVAPGCPAAGRPPGRVAVARAAAAPQRPGHLRPGPAGTGAARPRPGLPGTVYSGRALYYDPGTALGSCTLGPFPATGRYASLSPAQYAHGHACGTYLEVRGPAGTVRAEVVDLCPTCLGHTINLSRSAYTRIGDTRPGMIGVHYRWLADPPLPGPLELRVSVPAPGELAIQIRGHGNRLATVAISRTVAGAAFPAWHRLRLDPDDFWIARGVSGPGPFTLRITDVLGHQVILPRVTLLPGRLIRTGVRMYRPGAPAPAATRPARRGRPPAARPATPRCSP